MGCFSKYNQIQAPWCSFKQGKKLLVWHLLMVLLRVGSEVAYYFCNFIWKALQHATCLISIGIFIQGLCSQESPL
jgi:hypothetical protein